MDLKRQRPWSNSWRVSYVVVVLTSNWVAHEKTAVQSEGRYGVLKMHLDDLFDSFHVLFKRTACELRSFKDTLG